VAAIVMRLIETFRFVGNRTPDTRTMPTALVTGATAGIGAAFARRLARDGYDLVVVARDAERLDRLAAELPVAVEVLPADLADDADLDRVERRLLAGDVDLLVNNAGFGTNGELHEIDPVAEEAMLRVNARAVLRLCAAALPSMVARRSGGIVNVGSMAGFVPAAGSPTYAATKAYVAALSEGLATAYAGRGVRVLAVCPGFTRTEFHDRLGGRPSGLPRFMWLSAEQVVDTALRDLAAGRTLSIPGLPYRVIHQVVKHLPGSVVRRAAGPARSRRGRA
jgi:short-subunit dehydrogenase